MGAPNLRQRAPGYWQCRRKGWSLSSRHAISPEGEFLVTGVVPTQPAAYLQGCRYAGIQLTPSPEVPHEVRTSPRSRAAIVVSTTVLLNRNSRGATKTVPPTLNSQEYSFLLI